MKMRTIKFRGITVDTRKWVEGDLIQGVGTDKSGMAILPVVENNFTQYQIVLPESVGMFTGLTDSEGREIWEGDCVTGLPLIGWSDQNKITGAVFFDDSGMWKVCVTKDELTDTEYLHELVKNKSHQLEITGTIHDHLLNPTK